jgi:hypothetical protein
MLHWDSPRIFWAGAFLGWSFALTVYPCFKFVNMCRLLLLVVALRCGKWQGRTEAVAVADSLRVGGRWLYAFICMGVWQ